MTGTDYYLRLAATFAVAGLFGAAIFNPGAGKRIVSDVATAQAAASAVNTKTCASGEPPLEGPFAPIDDIISISPLGGVTAPGEPLPAPAIRLNTRKGKTIFDRRVTTALAPAKADITAIERRTLRKDDGGADREIWSVHFSVCDSVSLVYDDLDAIDASILRRAGGLKSFAEIGGPDHLAIRTAVRVKKGDAIGTANGFDVMLEDARATPAQFDRPERYQSNTYAEARAISAPEAVLKAIASDVSRIECPLDYLPERTAAEWKAKLGDAWGIRRAGGEDACRTAIVDKKGAAQGVWFTDAANNGRTSKVSAVALAPDSIDPGKLIFALHGRVKSLMPNMIALNPFLKDEKAEAARDFLTFEAMNGRINAAFAEVRPGEVYCYQNLRVNFVGPKVNGVLLLEIEPQTSTGAPPLMKIEARGDILSCIDLPDPWGFSGQETTFYR
ncbi:MAG: hypothetical protein R3C60_00430 [Parvularculaceae bacterium]